MDKKTLDILWERVDGFMKAYEVHKIETQGHLTSLNGEGERIKAILKDSIPREVFDRTMLSNDLKIESKVKELNAKIEILTTWQTSQQGSDKGKDRITQYYPWLIALAALAWGIFKK
jgi:hypothetical protein